MKSYQDKSKSELIKQIESLKKQVQDFSKTEKSLHESIIVDISERKQADEKIKHLNLVLRAIRNVNQLITKEKDRDKLLQRACENLIENRGYFNAWIALMDDSGKYVTSAEAGLGEDFSQMIEIMKSGKLTACGKKALKQIDVVVTEMPSATCKDCPLAGKYEGRGAMTIRLEYEGKIYGLASVSILSKFTKNEEEHNLFREITNDIAFALYSIEVEKERKQAEKKLQERLKELKCLYEMSQLAWRQDVSLEDLFKGTVEVLPLSMQFPEICCAMIIFGDKEFKSENFQLTEWKQSENITIDGKAVGVIDVCYLEKKPEQDEEPFLKEEFALLKSTSKILSTTISKNQADNKLQESEKHFKTLFNLMVDPVVIIDKKGKFLDITDRMEDITGFKRQDFIGKNFMKTKIATTKSKAILIKNLTKRLMGFHIAPYEVEILAKDGKILPFEVNAAQIEYKGKPADLVAFRDIGERKQAEQALRKSEDKYRALLTNINDLVMEIDSEGKFTYISPQIFDMFGYTQEESIGLAVYDFIHPDDIEKCMKAMETLDEVKHLEYRSKHKDGHYVHVSTSGRYISDGAGGFKTVSILRNITERKKAEEALTEERNLLRTLIDNLPDFIYAKDSKSRYIVCNQAHLRYLKTTTIDEIIGKSVFELFPQEMAAQYYADDQEIIRSGQPIFNKEEQSVNEAGDSVWNLTTKVPLRNRDGNILGLVGIAHDITERKQTEKQLQKSLKEKEILIKEIYHRVKNNLAVVSGLLNMQSTYIKDKEAIAAFQETRDRIYSISAVHSQLYNSEDYSTIDYTQYIKNLVNNIFYSSQISGPVKLHLELDDVILPIDKAIPCGLLLNEIVTNALKHAFPENRKGNLRIIMSSLEDNNCEIIVKDDGIGIPDNLNLEKSKTYGLKLINLLTKQIDRTLEIISEKGTEFRIRLNTEPGQVIR